MSKKIIKLSERFEKKYNLIVESLYSGEKSFWENNPWEEIKYHIDKSEMYSDSPSISITIPFPSREEAVEIYQKLKSNKKIMRQPHSFLLLDKEIDMTMALDNFPMAGRYRVVDHYIDTISKELESLGIRAGNVIPPRSQNEDYPSESDF